MAYWRWLGWESLVKATRNPENRLWILWFMVLGFTDCTSDLIHRELWGPILGDGFNWMVLAVCHKEVPRLFAVLPLPIWICVIGFRGFAWQSDLNFWQQEVTLNPTPYSHVSLAIIQYNEGNVEAAMNNFMKGFKRIHPIWMDVCPSCPLFYLHKEGSLLLARVTGFYRGCKPDGEMMGLRAVILAGLGRWMRHRKLVQEIG